MSEETGKENPNRRCQEMGKAEIAGCKQSKIDPWIVSGLLGNEYRADEPLTLKQIKESFREIARMLRIPVRSASRGAVSQDMRRP
jgi:hypothetical protein